MRRWNGWGDDGTDVPLSPAAQALIAGAIGAGHPSRDVTFEAVCAAVPPSRLAPHPLVDAGASVRARHARGQGLPDLVALRSGAGLVFPDGVAQPSSAQEIEALVALAAERGFSLIPYGGGTSVTGHVNPLPGGPPVLTVSLARLDRLRHFDAASRLATFEPGITGPAIERQLGALGHRLGHYPQSFEYSSLGGWIATRSSGQQSRGYGRIEDLFAGGTVVTPAGTLRLPPFPASAAGPDLRHLVLGSEGRVGIVTEAVVRVSPLPEVERFEAVFLPDWDAALLAARQLSQSDVPLSMLRVSTPRETATTLALAARTRGGATLERLLRWRGAREPDRCLAVLAFSGSARRVKGAREGAFDLLRPCRAVRLGGSRLGRAWQKSRFRAPYLRNTLWSMGYAVDTVETATTWTQVPRTVDAVEGALRGALVDEGERIWTFTHLSHVYATGASVYTTFVFRTAGGAEATCERWTRLKAAASRAIVREGATITHQHGVGSDHAAYLEAEKGALGVRALRRMIATFDERGLLNPGKLLPPDAG
ncbi:MAG TPA: FAD-binding oxidoreductase [Vicinamibacteria bacterium]|nr:FAD-binding oxidoreductase [Vicinamibacteria bacterium]